MSLYVVVMIMVGIELRLFFSNISIDVKIFKDCFLVDIVCKQLSF